MLTSPLTLDWVDFPLLPHAVACSVRFDPGGSSGDWADVVLLGGGRLAVVVGDAMGWGSGAEPLAKELSRAARLLLASGAAPGQVLAHLDAIVHPLGDVICTAAVAVVDPAGGHVELVSAGHPPPLVIPRRPCAGQAELLPCRPLPPLGFGPVDDVRASRWTLPPSVLLFYTDGLIDGRRRNLDVELNRLTAAATCPDGDLAGLCERVLMAQVPGPPEDDATVLALAVGGVE